MPAPAKKGGAASKKEASPARKGAAAKKVKKEASPAARKETVPVENLSLRERLALQANADADKAPPQVNALYDKSMGQGLSKGDLDILSGKIGQKRGYDKVAGQAAQSKPKNQARKRQVVEESESELSSEFSDESEYDG